MGILHKWEITDRNILSRVRRRSGAPGGKAPSMTLQQNPAKNAGTGQPTVVLKSVCRSCHGGCGALLHVRDGVLVKVEGDLTRRSITAGCARSERSRVDLVNHPNRLKYPRRRRRPARLRASGNGYPGTKRSTRLQSVCWRSARNSGRKRSRSAPGPAAITSAGSRASAMRSARRTGASPALPNASIRASTPVF